MQLRRIVPAACLLVVAALSVAWVAPRPAPAWAAERPAELTGLYRIEVPDHLRPSARLRPAAAEVSFLRLYADGRSRLENVTVRDVDESARPALRVAPPHRSAWEVRTLGTPGAAGRLDRLCVEWVGKFGCDRFERDGVTGDITLFADGSAGRAKVRLERVR